jgi:hypothetical protein
MRPVDIAEELKIGRASVYGVLSDPAAERRRKCAPLEASTNPRG